MDNRQSVSIRVNKEKQVESPELTSVVTKKTTCEDQLLNYLKADYPAVVINSFEDQKIDRIIESVVEKLPEKYTGILEWNYADGLVDFKTKSKFGLTSQTGNTIASVIQLLLVDLYDTEDLNKKVLVIRDIYSFQESAYDLACIKKLITAINRNLECAIIFVSGYSEIPHALSKYVVTIDVEYPDAEEIDQIIGNFLVENNCKMRKEIRRKLIIQFKGLTEYEIISNLKLAFVNDRKIDSDDLKMIFEQKQQIIRQSGILELVDAKENLLNIGGLKNLKPWIRNKARIFSKYDEIKQYGVDVPKGVLLVGMPGCGKSLNAKAIATMFKCPLLRFDMGAVLGKYIGESEHNMRNALKIAEAVSPCVLWMDEIEKGFAGVGGNGAGADITTRIMGSFLTWMQENISPVFVVATANSIDQLPPELMRKGRFDEVFYIGCPSEIERKEILDIHLNKRSNKYIFIQLTEKQKEIIAKQMDGYSGAEIEGVVKVAYEKAYLGKKKITAEMISDIMEKIYPLSETMKDKFSKADEMCANNMFLKA